MDLEGARDDNAKLQRLIKENAKQLGLVKELKASNDQLRAVERRLRDEVTSLNERMRVLKADSQRKDNLARELKEKLDQVLEEGTESKERISEIERLKETVKKLRLEIEIKENQVRSLKLKLDHFENECDSLKKS